MAERNGVTSLNMTFFQMFSRKRLNTSRIHIKVRSKCRRRMLAEFRLTWTWLLMSDKRERYYSSLTSWRLLFLRCLIHVIISKTPTTHTRGHMRNTWFLFYYITVASYTCWSWLLLELVLRILYEKPILARSHVRLHPDQDRLFLTVIWQIVKRTESFLYWHFDNGLSPFDWVGH